MSREWSNRSVGIVCFVIGAICGGAVVMRPWIRTDPETSILFPDLYGDHGSNLPHSDQYMNIQGRWSQEVGDPGSNIFHKNNYAVITCQKEKGECLYSLIEQWGPNLLSDIGPPEALPIEDWKNGLITASDRDDDATGCFRTTINIDRNHDTAEMVREPINQAKLECAHTRNSIEKYILKRPLSWYVTHPNEKPE